MRGEIVDGWLYTIPVTRNQVEYAMGITENKVLDFSHIPEWEFLSSDAKKTLQYVGNLGETVFADLMGLERPKQVVGSDGGADYVISGKSVDIKTMRCRGMTKRYYRNNLAAHQLHSQNLDTDIYLFASYYPEKHLMQFRGYIKKTDIKREWFKPKGSFIERGRQEPHKVYKDMYSVPCSDLKPFNPRTFYTEMSLWGF